MRKTLLPSSRWQRLPVRSPRHPQAHSVALPQASRLRAAIMSPPHTEQVAGHTTILAVANGCNSVSMTAMAGGSAGCEFAADPRLRRDWTAHRNHRRRAEGVEVTRAAKRRTIVWCFRVDCSRPALGWCVVGERSLAPDRAST